MTSKKSKSVHELQSILPKDHFAFIDRETGKWAVIYPDGKLVLYNEGEIKNIVQGMIASGHITTVVDILQQPQMATFEWKPYGASANPSPSPQNGMVYYNRFRPGKYMLLKNNPDVITLDQVQSIKFILESITNGDHVIIQWILNHLAAKLQSPGRKLKTALLLLGDPGCGKGIFAKDIAGELFIDGYGNVLFRDVGRDSVESKYSNYLIDVIVVNFNEIASNRKEALKMEDHFKRIVTETPLDVNLIYRGPTTIPNITYPIIASNHEIPINIEEKDRRYCVCRGSNAIPPAIGHRLCPLIQPV